MKLNGEYVIDKVIILQKSYNLLCVFFANKEISRRSDPSDLLTSLSALEDMFLAGEVSRLLLEIAISVRVLDDQMKKLPSDNTDRMKYERAKMHVDKLEYGMFDFDNVTLRETCNKIMHSVIMEPHTKDGSGAHELDIAYREGMGDKEIDWKYLNGYVRLSGTKWDGNIKENIEWFFLLNIEIFVNGIQRLLQ